MTQPDDPIAKQNQEAAASTLGEPPMTEEERKLKLKIAMQQAFAKPPINPSRM